MIRRVLIPIAHIHNLLLKVAKIPDYIFLPVRILICKYLGSIRFVTRKRFIRNKEIREIKKQLKPGDILLKRDKWLASNFGIAGFWTHTGIYTGTLKELDEYFKGVDFLDKMKISDYLKKNYLNVYKKLKKKNHRLIEVVTDGVKINPLEKMAKVDYFAALRPNLDKKDVFKALMEAFAFYNMPFDYRFNFSTNDKIVCIELIYKSFLSDNNKKGLSFDLEEYTIGPPLFPNDIAKKFDEEFDLDNRELEFVLFYDSDKKKRKSVSTDVHEFRKVWKRSRWDFVKK